MNSGYLALKTAANRGPFEFSREPQRAYSATVFPIQNPANLYSAVYEAFEP